MVNKITTPPTTSELIGKINELVDNKQDTLVSGTNIKTVNGTSILGSGNIDIQGGGTDISNHKVNGAPLSNTSSHFFGVSTSAAADVEKVVSIPSITELTAGVAIIVLPTVTSKVANATLKLNNFTAYPMRYQNSAITTTTGAYTWTANTPSVFVFDGDYWRFVCQGYRQVYSTMSVSEGTTGTATTSRVVRADYLKSIILGTKLTGLSTSTTGAVAATDTVLVGMGKLQATKADKSAIPTVNNATLTIQKNGSNVATFTANASSNVTANISVPNTVSSVSSSSTNADAVGAKLFYDTVGDIEAALNSINSGGAEMVNLSWSYDYIYSAGYSIKVNDETVANSGSSSISETLIGSYAVGSEVKVMFGVGEPISGEIQLYVNNVLIKELATIGSTKTYTFLLEEETVIRIVFSSTGGKD